MRTAIVTSLIALSLPTVTRGQVVTVVVRDSATSEALDDALASLLDSTAALLGANRTSRQGQALFRAPAAGHYAFRVQRIGWRQIVSPWIPVADADMLEITFRAPGARDYVDVIASIGLAGLITNTWRDAMQVEHRCIGSYRSPSRRDCVVVYVDNIRTDAESAVDLATPDNLDFAIWLPAIDAGVLYGGDAAAGVLHLFTKAYRRTR